MNFIQSLRCYGNKLAAVYLVAFPRSKPVSAKSNAARLLKAEIIQQRIMEIKAELSRKYSVSAEALVFYLAQVLHLDRRLFLDENGEPIEPHLLDTEAARIIDLEIVVNRKGKKQAIHRIPRRLDAAIELARMMGMHKDKMELTDKNGDSMDASRLSEIERASRVSALTITARKVLTFKPSPLLRQAINK